MDADTRHSLKQNELAEALSRIDFHDKRLLTWLGVILLVAVVYSGVKLWGWQSRRAADADWDALADIAPAAVNLGDAPLDQLRRLADASSGPTVEAISRLRLVRGLWARAHGAPGEWTNEAMRELEAVRNAGDVPAALRATALYMIGKVHETRREFDAAAKCYQELQTSAEFAGSPFVELADMRAENLARLREPVPFQAGIAPLVLPEAPPPTTAPASAPAAPAPAEVPASQPADGAAPAAAEENAPATP